MKSEVYYGKILRVFTSVRLSCLSPSGYKILGHSIQIYPQQQLSVRQKVFHNDKVGCHSKHYNIKNTHWVDNLLFLFYSQSYLYILQHVLSYPSTLAYFLHYYTSNLPPPSSSHYFCTHKRFKFVSYISQCLLFLWKKVANYFRRLLSIRFFSCCQILYVIMCFFNVWISNKYCLSQHFNLIPSDKHKAGKIVWIRQELLKCIIQINRQ